MAVASTVHTVCFTADRPVCSFMGVSEAPRGHMHKSLSGSLLCPWHQYMDIMVVLVWISVKTTRFVWF